MEGAVLVTGATGGLGRATALALAAAGRPVIVGGRRPGAVDGLVEEIQQAGGRATSFVADLSRLGDVHRAVDDTEWPSLRGIVCNAGLTLMRPATTEDGFEMTFGVNVLAHHLLVARLLPHLASPARLVFLSSGTQIPDHKLARRFGIPAPRWVGARALARPDLASDDEQLPDMRQRYSTSKLGNVLQARAFQAHLRAAGRDVDVFAIDPGLMVETDLARQAPAPVRFLFQKIGLAVTPFIDGMRRVSTSARDVAALVDDDAWTGRGFLYLDGDQPFPASADGMNDVYRDALWADAAELLGLSPDLQAQTA